MSEADTARHDLVQYWLEKASEAYCVAKANYEMSAMSAAVNRLYYAAFYAVSAVLAARGLKYGKHSAVQSCLHRDFVKTGLLSKEIGAVYDELVETRHEGDYTAFATFEKDQVLAMLERTEALLTRVRELAENCLKEQP